MEKPSRQDFFIDGGFNAMRFFLGDASQKASSFNIIQVTSQMVRLGAAMVD